MHVSETVTKYNLPLPVERILDSFVEAARNAFEADLCSVVLFGSGADGKLRATSDLNVILVLKAFGRARVDRLREPLRVAQAAVRLTAMFLLEAEIGAAVEAFAVKFSDVLRRRRVIYGEDPFARVSVPRNAVIARLRQVLLNEILRLRDFYALRSLREEQVALVIAEAAGPLCSFSVELLELAGHPSESPEEALRLFVASFSEPGWDDVLAHMSDARERRFLAPGVAGDTLFRLIDLAGRMQEQAKGLS